MARLLIASLFALLIVASTAQSPASSPSSSAAIPPVSAVTPTAAAVTPTAASGPAAGSSPSDSPSGSPSSGAVSMSRVAVGGASFVAVALVSALVF